MASNGISPRYDGGEFFSPAVLSGACEASLDAYTHGCVKKEIGNITVIAFPGSLDVNAFSQTTTKYGECKINTNNTCFGSMVEGVSWKGPGKPALVHQGALNKFLDFWSNGLQQEVEVALRAGKSVLFTGYSIGGGIATLATLATLEKWPKCSSVYCVTFGMPLIGDEVLARAVCRQGWAKQFCHLVSKVDSFARILLVPCGAVSLHLESLLPYWSSSMQPMDYSSIDVPMNEGLPANLDISKFFSTVLQQGLPAKLEISKFFSTVLQHASAVANYNVAINMDPSNKLIAAIRPALKLSPYRPFGYYMFCSGSGAGWVENFEAVLPMLYYTLATATQDQALEASISEHTEYRKLFPNVITNMVKLVGLSNIALSQAAASSFQTAIEAQLDALGLGIQNAQARLALRAAGEVEKQIAENVKEVEDDLRKLEGREIPELKQYRTDCLREGRGYYDAFKLQKLEKDFKANLNRLKLASFWDRIVDMVENHKLPDDFQCREEWIKAGTEYRRLVEPLDIANYYRLGKHEDSGHYLTSARPRRYQMIQKWLENIELNKGLTQDSCFWANVEELTCAMNNCGERPQEVRAKCEEIQKLVMRMIDAKDLCMEEIGMEDSSFMKWWKLLGAEERAVSPLSTVFAGNVQSNGHAVPMAIV